jgi:hypothetical protein
VQAKFLDLYKKFAPDVAEVPVVAPASPEVTPAGFVVTPTASVSF